MVYAENLKSYFSIIESIPGFFTYDMLLLFNSLNEMRPSEKPILEIGVFCGKSLAGLAIAFPNNKITGIDPFYPNFLESPAFEDEAIYLSKASNNLSPEERKDIFWKKMKELEKIIPNFSANERITITEITQNEFISINDQSNKFQLIHIDGEHTYQAIIDCLDALPSLLAENAWIIVDDILNPGFPDISEAMHSHSSYRKIIWPIFYGFNKGVYLFNPTNPSVISKSQKTLITLYSRPEYAYRILFDGAIEVERRLIFEEEVVSIPISLRKKINHFFHKLIDKLL